MKISMIRLHGAVLVAVLLIGAVEALAQKPAAAAQEISESFTVEAIDHASRVVTLKDKAGLLEDVYCGPEVQRFDALKVGDTVTFRYYESVILAIRKPGQQSGLPKTADGPTLQRAQGAKPGATISKQETATVAVTAIDPKVPSLTVVTRDNSRSTFKVEDKNNLKGVAVGDKVEITYTVALLISVK